MANRSYDTVVTPTLEGAARTSFVIECASCGTRDFFLKKKNISPEAATQKFLQIGWTVGSRPSGDLCPQCNQKRRSYSMKPAEEIKAEAPPAMTRDDKRIINLKLHEVYINETIGYDADWTDHRVAESLGIPRAWVSQVREELFGPAGEPPEIRALEMDLATVTASVKRIKEAAKINVAEVASLLATADKELKRISDRLDKLRYEITGRK